MNETKFSKYNYARSLAFIMRFKSIRKWLMNTTLCTSCYHYSHVLYPTEFSQTSGGLASHYLRRMQSVTFGRSSDGRSVSDFDVSSISGFLINGIASFSFRFFTILFFLFSILFYPISNPMVNYQSLICLSEGVIYYYMFSHK